MLPGGQMAKTEAYGLHDVRKELDTKIESKASSASVCWALGIIVLALITFAGIYISQMQSTGERLAVLETKYGVVKKN
jgi:hypothetical protein